VRVVADASALAAIIFHEDGCELVARQLDGATLCAPRLLPFELANAAVKKAQKHPGHAPEIFARLAEGLAGLRQIKWHDVDAVDVAILARLTRLTAYDASYLWLAGWLEADLVTLDRRLAAAVELDSAQGAHRVRAADRRRAAGP
jgi:predicted nucleic acid-binding protein